jgi:hypothetical protein
MRPESRRRIDHDFSAVSHILGAFDHASDLPNGTFSISSERIKLITGTSTT